MATVAAGDDRSRSTPESSAGIVRNSQDIAVRCVVHNFDDEDAKSTIRSLLEPDVIVQHCQPATTGLSDFSSKIATT